MKKCLRIKGLAALSLILSVGFTACDSTENNGKTNRVITFEDVPLDSTGVWNGNDLSGDSTHYALFVEYEGGFTSGILYAHNTWNETWGSWSGMACSNHTDRETPGYDNQYSVFDISGAEGSEQFVVLYPSDTATCSFASPVDIQAVSVNNATYAYLAIKEGNDGYTMQTQFEEGDYFILTITGMDENGTETGSVNYYLADFRDGKTYVCDDWTQVDLTTLGKIKSLGFSLSSSDMGLWGMNTPGYACIDNLVYQ